MTQLEGYMLPEEYTVEGVQHCFNIDAVRGKEDIINLVANAVSVVNGTSCSLENL